MARRVPGPVRVSLALACALGIASAAAVTEDLPPSLRGHLDVEVERCAPGPAGSRLLEATVRVTTGNAEIRLPELHCGAFVPGSDEVLFLNAVEGRIRVPARSTRRFTALFPGDARHTECRCVVADVRRLDDAGDGWREIDDWATELWDRFAPERDREPRAERRRAPRLFAGRGAPTGAGPDETPDAIATQDVAARARFPFSLAPRLRREWIVRPELALRDAPDGEANGPRLAPGDGVDVLALRRGAKQVRIDSGESGWIDADAATPAMRPSTSVEQALDALATRGHADDASFCRDRSDALQPLVFALLPEDRTAYVTSEWFLLEPRHQDAFQAWTRDCYGIARIVDVGEGALLRSHDWGDRPSLHLASDEPGTERR